MRRGFLAGVVILAACAVGPREDLGTASSAIVGGTDDPGDPAVVAIVSETLGLTLCSGALVSPRMVLTAGHCNFTKITVRFGQDITAPSRKINVTKTTQHPKYTKEGAPYDFALLELETAVDDITPLAVRTTALTQSDVGKTTIRHIGFGVSNEADGSGAGHKRTVTYPITQVTDVLLYSGAPGKQTCDIDSGAPGLVKDADGVERIAGVVSDGPNCHTDGWDGRADLADLQSFIAETQNRIDAESAGDGSTKSSGGCNASDHSHSRSWEFLVALSVLMARRRRGLTRLPA